MSEDSREKSAIDAIYSIEEKLNSFAKRFQVIEDNLKLINNKLLKLSKASTPLPPVKVDHTPEPSLRQQKVEKLLLGNVKLFGFIVNKSTEPIPDVTVNVFDSNSQLVKTVKTDGNGYWEVRLPSGKFGVEYIHKKFKPVNKTVELLDGTKEFEVR